MILITRPIDKASKLKSKLSKCGYKCHIESLSKIKIKDRNFSFKSNYVYLISSPRTVNYFIKNKLQSLNAKLLVIGLSSKNELKQAGFKNLIYGAQDSSDMIKFLKKSDIKQIYHVTGTIRNRVLFNEISKIGITQKDVILYETIFRKTLSKKCVSLIKSKKIRQVLIYSSANAEHFIYIMNKANIHKESKSLTFFCLSKKIANFMIKKGYLAKHSALPTENELIKLLTNNC